MRIADLPRHAPLAVLLALALSACGPESPPAPSPSGAAAEPVLADAPAPDAPTREVGEDPDILRADPLASCDGAQVAIIHWGEAAVADGAAAIEVEGSDPRSVFATVGAAGSKATGEWAHPGMVLVLRGIDDERERARVTLRGPDC